MHRIDTGTATSDNKFTDGDSSQSIAATALNAAWFNSVQEEICKVVEDAGISLDPANDSQLLAALKSFGSFKAVSVPDTEYHAETGSGSTVVFFESEDALTSGVSIVGTFQPYSLIVVVLPWKTTPESTTVTINGAVKTLYRNLVGVYLISSDGVSVDRFLGLVETRNSLLRMCTIDATEMLLAGGLVLKDSVVFDSASADTKSFQLRSAWTYINQSRRVLNNTTSDIVVTYYTPYGNTRTVTIPSFEFRTFVWTGLTTTSDDFEYCRFVIG